MTSKQAHKLEALEEDIAFQRRFWVVERIAWAGFVVALALALLGLTGSGGVLSQGRSESAFGVLEYPRVSRWQAVDQMRIEFAPSVGAQAEVALDRSFVGVFEITGIHPEPSTALTTPAGVRYQFEVNGGGAAVFHLRPVRPALFPAAAVRLESAETQFRPLVLP